MAKAIVNDLIDQYQRTFRMLAEDIGRFTPQQWISGLSSFHKPAKLAMHIYDTLDFYSCGLPGNQYPWGYRFGGGWWELPDDRLPDQASILAYAREIEEKLIVQLSNLTDENLSRPYETSPEEAKTLLGHYIYALRHTLHHHGELATLAVYHGHEGGSWE